MFVYDIGSVKIRMNELDTIDFSRLEHLALPCNADITNLDFLARTPNLKSLNLSYCTQMGHNLYGLGRVRKLRVLKLTSICSLNNPDPADIAIMTETLCAVIPNLLNLRDLNLESNGNAVNDQLVQIIIQHLKQLEVLRLSSTAVTDLGLAGTYIDEIDPRLGPEEVARRQAVYQEYRANNDVGLSLSGLQSKLNLVSVICNFIT